MSKFKHFSKYAVLTRALSRALSRAWNLRAWIMPRTEDSSFSASSAASFSSFSSAASSTYAILWRTLHAVLFSSAILLPGVGPVSAQEQDTHTSALVETNSAEAAAAASSSSTAAAGASTTTSTSTSSTSAATSAAATTPHAGAGAGDGAMDMMVGLEAFKQRAMVIYGEDGNHYLSRSHSHNHGDDVSTNAPSEHTNARFHHEVHTAAEHMKFHGTAPLEEHVPEKTAERIRKKEILDKVLSMPQVAGALNTLKPRDAHAVFEMSRPVDATQEFTSTDESYCFVAEDQIKLHEELFREREADIEERGEQVLRDSEYHDNLPPGLRRHLQEEDDMRQAAAVAIGANLHSPLLSDDELNLRNFHLQEQILEDLTENSSYNLFARIHDLGTRYHLILERGVKFEQIVQNATPNLDLSLLSDSALQNVDAPALFAVLKAIDEATELQRQGDVSTLSLVREPLSQLTMMQRYPQKIPNLFLGEHLASTEAESKEVAALDGALSGGDINAAESSPAVAGNVGANTGAGAAAQFTGPVYSVDLLLAEQVKILQQVSPDLDKLRAKQALLDSNPRFMPPPRERPRKGSILQEDLKMRQELYRSGMSAQSWLRRREQECQKIKEEEGSSDTFAETIGDVVYYSQLYLNYQRREKHRGIFILGQAEVSVLEVQKANAVKNTVNRYSRYLQDRHLKSALFDRELLSTDPTLASDTDS